MIECAKRCQWEDFLELVDEKSIWTAHCYASGDPTDRGRAHVLMLRAWQPDGSMCTVVTNEDKSRLLCKTFFPRTEQA